MIKALAFFGKKPEWSEADFLSHYLERHAPLVAGTAGFTRSCTKYVQNVPVEGEADIPFETRPAGRTAVTELWFPSQEAITTAYSAEDYLARVRPDEKIFAATGNSNVMLCEEQPIWAAPVAVHGNPDLTWARAPRIRLFVCRVPNARISTAELQHGWQGAIHGMFDLPVFQAAVRGYVLSIVIPGQVADLSQEANNPISLIEEFFFDTVEEAVRFWTAVCNHRELNQIWDHWTEISDREIFLARSHTVFE